MELVHVEELCRKIYGANSSPLERFEAHRALLFLQVSASYIDQCRYILERSTEATALMYAAQSLIVVMRKDWGNISPTARISLRDFLLEFLRRLADSRHYLTKKLVQVLCELTRRAWCEDNRHHTIIEHCVTFMQSSNTADLGLRIMADLVAEFDQGRAALFDEPTRRASQAFREQELGLVKAFNVSLDAVWAARSARNLPLLCESLRCLLACLSFDFASTGSDESVPGVSCVYLPKPWVPRVASENAINNFFALYTEQCQSKVSPLNEEAASLTLQCLVMVSGTRKNCHDTLSRAGFLRALMTGMEVMIRTRMGFDQSEECAHHACRLIARFKVTTQLSELAVESIFPKWFSALRDFTCDCLHSFMTISPRSISYLLEFWSGMITSWASTSSSQLGDTDAYNISENLAPIVVAYLTSRSNMCEAAASDNDAIIKQSLAVAREAGLRVEASGAACDIDEIDPLASEDALLDEIGYVIFLARMRYTSFQDVIGSILFSASSDFILSQSHSVTYPGQQARLAFAMYFVGALIGGSFNRGESNQHLDELNVDLATKAFRLVLEKKNPCTFALEMGTLYFLQCFQYLLLESRTRAQVAKSEMKARRGRRIQGIRSFLTTQSSLLSQPKSVPPSPNNNNYPLPSSYGSDPSQIIPISQPGSANDDIFVHRTVEMFPRPIRSFDFGLGSDEAEEVSPSLVKKI